MCHAVLVAWHARVVATRVLRRGMDRLHWRRNASLLQAHVRMWREAVVENR